MMRAAQIMYKKRRFGRGIVLFSARRKTKLEAEEDMNHPRNHPPTYAHSSMQHHSVR